MTAPVEMVKQFWEGRAEAPGVGDSEVTHADVWQRELEIETILKYLGRGDRVLDNVATVLRPGGRFIFIEGGRQGRKNLNLLRTTAGLEAMPTVWHNVDFDEAETLAYLDRDFVLERRLPFGVYDFVARVVHPLLVAPDAPVYGSRINQIAATLALHVDAVPQLSPLVFRVLAPP